MEMAQYEADKIVHLLQLCCWKARCNMDQKGMGELSDKIANSAESSRIIPNERYFVDLLSDATVAMKKDNLVGRRSNYINLLLNFAGFNSWKDWETNLYSASEYLNSEGLDLSGISKLDLAVCFPSFLDRQVCPDLAFVRKSTGYPLHLIECAEKEIEDQMRFVQAQLEEFPFVVWAIPLGWKERLPLLKESLWEELVRPGRIVPVWIGESDAWGSKAAFIPWLKHHQTISGVKGLLTSILYAQEVVKKMHRPPADKAHDTAPSARIQNFQHSRGTFLLGDMQIKSQNTALGDINQTIYNHKKKES